MPAELPNELNTVRLAPTSSDAAATTAATRRLARRQRSWFGPDERIRWLRPPSSDRDAWHEQVVAAVRAVLAGDPWPADLG